MTQILKLRAEEAQMLGFANYAEFSLASKMADTPQQVAEFLLELAQRAKPFAENDLKELREFAASATGTTGSAGMGRGLCQRKVAPATLCFLRAGSETIFP